MAYATAQDGTEIYYELHGAPDRPCVFLGPHFYATGMATAESLGMADPTPRYVELLQERFCLLIADYPRGIGKTRGVRPEDFAPEVVVGDYEAILDGAGIERCGWIGYSLGAVIGIQIACRTSRLWALSCGGWPVLDGPYREMLMICEAMAETPMDFQLAQDVAQQSTSFYRALQDFDEREELLQVECPGQAFMGADDGASGRPNEMAEKLRSVAPDLELLGWEVAWIEGGGSHLSSLEPAAVVEAVGSFFERSLSSEAG